MIGEIYVLAGQSNAGALRDEFNRELAHRLPQGSYDSAVVAVNGAPLLRETDFGDWTPGSELRERFIAELIQMLEENPHASIEEIYWVQGEGDTYKSDYEAYAENLIALVDEVLKRLEEAFPERQDDFQDLDFNVFLLSEDAPVAAERENWLKIREQQIEAANSHPNIEIIDPDQIARQTGTSSEDMFYDNVHYDHPFQDILMAKTLDKTMDEAHIEFKIVKIDYGYWVEADGSGQNTQVEVKQADGCAGVRGETFFGDEDRIVFEGSSVQDWEIKLLDDRIIFEQKLIDAQIHITNPSQIEDWYFDDEELSYTELLGFI